MSTDPNQPYPGGHQNPSAPQYPGAPQYPSGPHHAPGRAEILGDAVLPAAPPARRRGPAAAVAVAVGVATVGAGGYLAYGLVGGGGDRADAMLPANAVTVVTVDLDPSVSQKAGAIQFARKFPQSRDLDWSSPDKDPRKWLYEQVARNEPNAPAWSEVQQWLGKRAGLAVLPAAAGADQPSVVVALQVRDQAKAKASLTKITSTSPEAVGVAGEGEWVLVGQTQAEADAALAAAKSSSIADAPTYSADLEALGGEGVANVWLDYAGLSSVTAGRLAAGATSPTAVAGMAGMAGHGAATLRFDGPAIEVVGSFRGLNPATMPFAGSTTVEVSAPADAVGTLSIGGLGEQTAAHWPALLDQLGALGGPGGMTSDDLQAQTGLKLPGDLAALLGEQLSLVVGDSAGEPSTGLKVKSTDPDLDGALGRLTAFAAEAGTELTPTKIPGGYVLTFGAPVPGLADGGTLSSTAAFTGAVPDAGKASAVGYVDIARAIEAFGSGVRDTDRASLAPLQSLGLSVRRDGDTAAGFTLRLTTR